MANDKFRSQRIGPLADRHGLNLIADEMKRYHEDYGSEIPNIGEVQYRHDFRSVGVTKLSRGPSDLDATQNTGFVGGNFGAVAVAT